MPDSQTSASPTPPSTTPKDKDEKNTSVAVAPSEATSSEAAGQNRFERFFSGRSWQFYVSGGIGAVIAILLCILLVAILIALFNGPTSNAASFVSIMRDLFIILLVMEGIVVGVALIVLIVQLANLVNILQNEIKPIVDSAQEAVSTVKGTAEFMSKNVTEPAIKASSYLAGARALLREVSGLNRAMKPNRKDSDKKSASAEPKK